MGMQIVQPLWKIVWKLLKKLKIAILLLDIYLKKTKTLIRIVTYIPMFIAALFTIAKIWKKPIFPSIDEWTKNKEYAAYIKKTHKWTLGSITTNKASEGDGFPAELFQILMHGAVKVLHSICQQVWKTQQWPLDWKMSVFIPILKKDNAKECSNYCALALISHARKIMLKILQARLQSM